MIEEETVCAGRSVWHVFAHQDSAVIEKEPRSDERVIRMLAQLEAAPVTDRELEQMLNFMPDSMRKAMR